MNGAQSSNIIPLFPSSDCLAANNCVEFLGVFMHHCNRISLTLTL